VVTVGKQVEHLMPKVCFELDQVTECLYGFAAEAGNVADVMITTESHSLEAEKIFN
jgi:hypothetical protein